MTDDIYDYFSGNKARKVEPIEDDDDSGEFDDDLSLPPSASQTDTHSQLNDEDAPVGDPDDIFAAFAGSAPAPTSSKPANNTAKPRAAATPQPSKPTGVTAAEAEATAPAAKAVTSVQPTPTSAVIEEPADQTTPKKSGGHWDFLANMFGIAGSNSEPKEKAAKPQPTPDASSESTLSKRSSAQTDALSAASGTAKTTPAASDQSAEELPGEFFGFRFDDSDPSTIHETKTASSATGDDAQGNDVGENDNADRDQQAPVSKKSTRSSKRPAKEPQLQAEQDDDFVEFEIEELDTTDIDEDAAAARGRRSTSRKRGHGRNRHGSNRSQTSEVDDDIEVDVESSADTADSNPEIKDDGEDRSTRRGGRGRGRGRSRSRGRSRGRDEQNRDQENERDVVANSDDFASQSDTEFGDQHDDGFAVGIFEEDLDPRDIDPRNGGVDDTAPPRGQSDRSRGRGRGGRSRGGRGRGGRSRDDNRQVSGPIERSTENNRDSNRERNRNQRDTVKNQSDSWDDEVGLDNADADVGFGAGIMENDGEPNSNDRQPRSRGGRARRGGRGRGRNYSDRAPQDQGAPNDRDDRDFEEVREFSDSGSGRRSSGRSRRPKPETGDDIRSGGRSEGRGESSRPDSRGDRSDSRPSRGRSRNEGRSRSAEPREKVDYGQVPTWYDAITGVIDGNIKSHSSGGGGRSRGGRGRSGGGRSGSGRSGGESPQNSSNRSDRGGNGSSSNDGGGSDRGRSRGRRSRR